MSNRRYMIDIEGLGKMPGGVILAIGWCRFTPDGPIFEESGEVRLEIQPQLDAGLTVDGDVLGFWLKQTALPWATDTKEQEPQYALTEFSMAMRKSDEIWSKPPQYDMVGIRSAFQAFEVKQSWPFRVERCFRTLGQTAPSGCRIEPLADGTKHGALVDATHQAREAAGMLKAISQ